MRFNLIKIKQKAAYYLMTVLIAVASLVSVAIFWRNPLPLSLIMLALAAAMLAICFSKRLLLFFIIAALAGTLAEMCGIYSGAWSYATSPAPYTPVWLLPLWGVAGIFMLRLREAINDVL
jgi:O-antigen ligase